MQPSFNSNYTTARAPQMNEFISTGKLWVYQTTVYGSRVIIEYGILQQYYFEYT